MKKILVFGLFLALMVPIAAFGSTKYNISLSSKVTTISSVADTEVLSGQTVNTSRRLTTVLFSFGHNLNNLDHLVLEILCSPDSGNSFLNANFGRNHLKGTNICGSNQIGYLEEVSQVTFAGSGIVQVRVYAIDTQGNTAGSSRSILIELGKASVGDEQHMKAEDDSKTVVSAAAIPQTPSVTFSDASNEDELIKQLQTLLMSLIQQLMELIAKQGSNPITASTPTAPTPSCTSLDCLIVAAKDCKAISATIPVSMGIIGVGSNTFQISPAAYGACDLIISTKNPIGNVLSVRTCSTDKQTIADYLSDLKSTDEDPDSSTSESSGVRAETIQLSTGRQMVCSLR